MPPIDSSDIPALSDEHLASMRLRLVLPTPFQSLAARSNAHQLKDIADAISEICR